MITDLSWKQEAFIRRMSESAEQEVWGYQILLKRADFTAFFDALAAAGLFKAERNPEPVPIDDGRYVRVPYWSALDYLVACAQRAGETNDLDLSIKVMTVVRDVTLACRASEGRPDNYHTHRRFSEILGHIPLQTILLTDIDLIPDWLRSTFDRGGAARELDRRLMPRLLLSKSKDDWIKACRAMEHVTQVEWREDGSDKQRKKATTVVDDHWLKEFLEHHVSVLASKVGISAAEILTARLKEVYSEEMHGRSSYLFRPAVEDHEQNHSWGAADNRFVDALRDCLLAWADVDPQAAETYVDHLLRDGSEIVRRVALRVLNERWSQLSHVYGKHMSPELFRVGHLHELFHLLRDRFALFTGEQRKGTLDALRGIQADADWAEPERTLKRLQRTWLTAIAPGVDATANRWFSELQQDASLGAPSGHPDFLGFTETRWGPGPSPHSPQQLVELARDGSLVQRLNAFEPKDSWNGPTRRALVDALEEAVSIAPMLFAKCLPAFVQAQRAYQYGVINGFKSLRDNKGAKGELDWGSLWPALFTFVETLIASPEFWTEPVEDDANLTPTRIWIPPLVSELLRTGTRKEEDTYEPALLPRALEIVKVLLQKSEAQADVRDDPMTQAINSPRGKAVEALFSHVLRMCRVGDGRNGNHDQEWTEIRPLFDAELDRCKDANFEFSTLSAAYLANLQYINSDWIQQRVRDVFPAPFQSNLICAIDGLAYAPVTRALYKLLLNSGVLQILLNTRASRESARERLLERVALAYLWGDEELDSERFATIFRIEPLEDLSTISNFFWSLSNQELDKAQVCKVLSFWEKCNDWSKQAREPPKRLLSSLSRLAVYLTDLGADEAEWLENLAPFVLETHDLSEFVAQLSRLVGSAPQRVSSILRKVLQSGVPTFDYEDRLKILIRQLAAAGQRGDAIEYADRLRTLSGMPELYIEIAAP